MCPDNLNSPPSFEQVPMPLPQINRGQTLKFYPQNILKAYQS